MSYLVLARKYRPQDFLTVTGQEQVTKTLGNAIARDKVAHAHLFAGPRGVGKTSIARIFAKSLNCEKGPTASPCLKCRNCLEIAAGTSIAVREIDGASHNSVDNVRDLIDGFRSLPPPGSKFKVYIIDEVHMLSIAAFNALLKSLEEPPPNTIFILATTELHKIPDTILSRCVRHDLRALSLAQIESRLKEVASQEKLDIEAEVYRMIARLADGSMRDAQSLLDRVQSFCEGKITVLESSRLLGTVERSMLLALSQGILGRDPARVLALISEVFQRGVDPGIFLKEFVTIWREILLAKFADAAALIEIGLSADEAQELRALTTDRSSHDIQDLVQLAREGADLALRSAYPKYALEALVVRLATREPVAELGALLAQLQAGGGSSSGPGNSGGGGRMLSHRSGTSAGSSASAATAGSSYSTGMGTNAALDISGNAVSSRPEIVRPELSRQTAIQPTAQGVVAVSTKVAPAAVEWSAFVKFTVDNGMRVISESLKRITPIQFTLGKLEAQGGRFPISSLEAKDNKEKLLKALQVYSGVDAWSVKLSASDATTEGEGMTLAVTERQDQERRKKAKEEELLNHPKLQQLRQAFPGTSVEAIKVKE